MVVFDDLDLPMGVMRVRMEGGSGGQKGMMSVIDQLDSRAIPRIRVGIDRPPGRMGAADYVLKPFSGQQSEVIANMLPLVADAIETVVREGIVTAMDKFNS